MEQYAEIKQGEKGAWVSIVAYIFLSSLKLIIGYFYHSEALTADGINNSTDIVASLAVLIGLKISRKPPDHDHHYGHYRAETVAALVASFIMGVVGLDVLKNAFLSLFEANRTSPNILAGWVALACAIILSGVYFFNSRLAKKINNQALMAAAKDNLSDAYVSVGAFVGIMGAQFGLPWLDPLAAFIVGIMICKTAWTIFSEASHSLTDGFDDVEKIKSIKKTIAKIHGVKFIKEIKARKHGNNILLDVIIEVNPTLNVVESHEITEVIEERLEKEQQVQHVQVHIEPAHQEDIGNKEPDIRK